jgi:hypothetical protein
MSNETKQKPAAQFRAGSLSVSVWERRSNDKAFYNATPQRAYLDDKDTSGGADGTWKYSDSFNRDDLPVIAALMVRAFEWIVSKQAEKP